MAIVENYSAKGESLNKSLHRILLYLVKMIPVFVTVIYILNTVLSYFYVDLPILSYIVQYLFISFMYLASIIFRFCRWHRILLHYITTILTLNIIDYHFGIPMDDRSIFLLYGTITGLAIVLVVYFKFISCKH